MGIITAVALLLTSVLALAEISPTLRGKLIERPADLLNAATLRRAALAAAFIVILLVIASTPQLGPALALAAQPVAWIDLVTGLFVLAARGHARVRLKALRRWSVETARRWPHQIYHGQALVTENLRRLIRAFLLILLSSDRDKSDLVPRAQQGCAFA